MKTNVIDSIDIADVSNVDVLRNRSILEKSNEVEGWVTIEVIRKNGQKELICEYQKNLLTTSGRDFFHAQVYTNTAVGTRGGGFVAVSDDTGDPASGDTVLVGEISSGGLSRADATTKTHTVGTNVTTLIHQFTASASFINIHKSGLFNAASSGQMTHAAKFTTDVSLEIDDTLQVTWTLTLG
jgi:activator of HSP90 ATPase